MNNPSCNECEYNYMCGRVDLDRTPWCHRCIHFGGCNKECTAIGNSDTICKFEGRD